MKIPINAYLITQAYFEHGLIGTVICCKVDYPRSWP